MPNITSFVGCAAIKDGRLEVDVCDLDSIRFASIQREEVEDGDVAVV
jgi:hypothetical protein